MLNVYKLGKILGLNMYIYSIRKRKIIDSLTINQFRLPPIDLFINQCLETKYGLVDLGTMYCFTTRVDNNTIIISVPNCDPQNLTFKSFDLSAIMQDITELCDLIVSLSRLPAIGPTNYGELKIMNIASTQTFGSKLKYSDYRLVYSINNNLVNSITHSHFDKFNENMVTLLNEMPLLLESTGGNAELVIAEYISLIENAIVEVGFPVTETITIKKSIYSHFGATNKQNVTLALKKVLVIYFEALRDYNFISELSLAKQIKVYIIDNIRHKITLNDIAKQLHISLKRLNPCFKKEFHITINQYIRSKRIGIAKDLLIHTDLSLQYISDTLGYSSKNYFIYDFKKLTSITPHDFQVKHLQLR